MEFFISFGRNRYRQAQDKIESDKLPMPFDTLGLWRLHETGTDMLRGQIKATAGLHVARPAMRPIRWPSRVDHDISIFLHMVFIRGALNSRPGKQVIALTATHDDGVSQ